MQQKTISTTFSFNPLSTTFSQQFPSLYHKLIGYIKENPDYHFMAQSLDTMLAEASALEVAVTHLAPFSTILLVGMGGAINNPKAVIDYLPKKGKSFLYLDTTDPVRFQQICDRLNFQDTGVLVISKSGNTLETNALAHALRKKFIAHGITSLKAHFVFITSRDNTSELATFANEIGAIKLPHAEIGGRFAAFSNIVFLPLMLAGYDCKSYCMGAIQTLNDFFEFQDSSRVVKELAFLMNASSNRDMHVSISYNYQLCGYLELYDQIFGESLGKNGFVITPVSAIAPQIQHSQLQLYLDGKANKFFTILSIENSDEQIVYHNKTLQQLTNIQSEAFFATLAEANLPCRMIKLSPDLYSLGNLIMGTILETILLGIYHDINPFGQPAVEGMKAMVMKHI